MAVTQRIKLTILRWLLLFAMGMAFALSKKERFLWLFHYLRGSGLARIAPDHLVPVRTIALGRQRYRFKRPTSKGYWYGLHHSLHYGTYGFWGKPELFYLVGGMSFNIDFEEQGTRIWGKDVYDWHSNTTPEGETWWYDSPIPNKVRFLGPILEWMFGEEYFPNHGGFHGNEPSISNRLWADLEIVGAKPFTTYVDTTVSKSKWRRAARRAHSKKGKVW